MTADERATLAEECPDCGGNGLKSGGPSHANPCARCDGSGLLAEGEENREPDDSRWLAQLVYEFVLTGPRRRTALSEVEMQRFLAIRKAGGGS
jgi:hypothetical protein